jgi:hypothetical protein
MQVDSPALDAAFHHAVSDAGSSELHDHVRRPSQQRHAHQPVVEVRATVP